MKIEFEDGRDPVELKSGQVLTSDGEILEQHEVEFAYTREGRRTVGKEYPNPTPIAPPVGWVPTEPVHELIARMVQNQMRMQMEQERGEELETPEEADDFDVGDDFDPTTPYEHDFEPEHPWPASRAVAELEKAVNEYRNRGRIDELKQELEALANGRPWPPVSPDGGAGGQSPQAAKPSPEAPPAPKEPAKPKGSRKEPKNEDL